MDAPYKTIGVESHPMPTHPVCHCKLVSHCTNVIQGPLFQGFHTSLNRFPSLQTCVLQIRNLWF